MRTVQALAAKSTRDVAVGLARTFSAMPSDKQAWSPLDLGRTALNQIAECAVINAYGAQTLRDRAAPPFEGNAYQQACAALDTVEKAVAALSDSTKELSAAIETLPDDQLETKIQFPWDSEPSTLAEAALIPYWNMTYHIGQINYVQTLYGDKESH